MRIYVGNLSYQATSDDLKELFGAYGDVSEATVVTDRDSGRSRGFGFVEMANEVEAKAAIASLDQSQHMGRTLKVNEARARREHNSGSRRGGGGRGDRQGWW